MGWNILFFSKATKKKEEKKSINNPSNGERHCGFKQPIKKTASDLQPADYGCGGKGGEEEEEKEDGVAGREADAANQNTRVAAVMLET